MSIPLRPLDMVDVMLELGEGSEISPLGLRDPSVMSLAKLSMSDTIGHLDLEGTSSGPPDLYDGILTIGSYTLLGSTGYGFFRGFTPPVGKINPDNINGNLIELFMWYPSNGSLQIQVRVIPFIWEAMLVYNGETLVFSRPRSSFEIISYPGSDITYCYLSHAPNPFGKTSGQVRVVFT